MIPTTYEFRFPQDRNFDHFVACAPKNLEQFSFWHNKFIRFFQFQFNFLKLNQRDLNTNPNDVTMLLLLKTPASNKLYLFGTKTSTTFNFPKAQIHLFFLISLSLHLKSPLHYWHKSSL